MTNFQRGNIAATESACLKKAYARLYGCAPVVECVGQAAFVVGLFVMEFLA